MATLKFYTTFIFLICMFCLLTFTASAGSHVNLSLSLSLTCTIHAQLTQVLMSIVINKVYILWLILVAWKQTKSKLVESWWRLATQKICRQGNRDQSYNYFQNKPKMEILCRQRYNSNTSNFQWYPLFPKLEWLRLRH